MISQEEFPLLIRKATLNSKQDQGFVSDTADEMKKNVRSLPTDRMKQSWSPQRNQIHYPKEQLIILTNTSSLLRLVNLRGTIKIFKKLILCIRACIRLRNLIEQSTWAKSLKRLQTFQKSTLKYQQIVNEKFKEWCLAICYKSFSTIPKDIENYIKFTNSNLKKDKSKLSLINSMKFLLENLAFGTHPDNLTNEIKHYLFSQLFEHQKSNFTKFVSERTLYFSKTHGEITLMQQSMIIAEVLFFFRIAFIIIEHSTVNLFVKTMLISLLQYLFLEKHKNMKTIIPVQQNFVHLEFEENSNQKGNIKIIENSSEVSKIIIGLYENELIEEVLQMRPIFTEKIHQYFAKILYNLQVCIINI